MRLLARFPRPKRVGAKWSDAAAAAEKSESESQSQSPSKTKSKSKSAVETGDPMAESPESLPGIGPALAEKMAERGLTSVEDLLWLLPRRYDDVRDARQLADVASLDEGARATFAARVTSARMVFARGRRWAEVRLASLDARPASATVRWFNVWAGIDKRMPAGSEVVLSGAVKSRGGNLEFANPDILGITIDGRARRQGGAADHGPLSGRPGRSAGQRAQGVRGGVRAHRGCGR